MIRRLFRDDVQLSNRPSSRMLFTYAYLVLLALATVLMNVATRSQYENRPDSAFLVFFLIVASMIFGPINVRLERGHMSMTGMTVGAAALLLNPPNATIAGLSIGIGMTGRGRWRVVANSVSTATLACVGSVVQTHLEQTNQPHLGTRIIVLLVVNFASWVITGIGLSFRSGESIGSIVRHTFSREFYAAYAYFALAALLTSYVLNGSAIGYVLATIVFILSLALSDTLAGRRVRRVLESELSDADRHLFHSRAVEGVVHNLRNHLAIAVGYLTEVNPTRLAPADREALATATSAAKDAVTVLRTLSQGATPKVTYSTEPVDLNDLVSRALGMGRTRAREKEIELGLRESPDAVKVKADPLLLREVITNLVNNAIDAAPQHGHVELSAGRRSNGMPYFSVADNGPGVQDEHRHHLFEPHFTTKETGTGLGLFMSYGIIREHQGELLYEGNRKGAVFTVVLPPYA